MSDAQSARFNMIEAQIRTNDVTDVRIHAALDAVARERFVPTAKRALAYADVPVEIAQGRYLLDPRSFAKALQLARITAEDSVLDVGCGTRLFLGGAGPAGQQRGGAGAGCRSGAHCLRSSGGARPMFRSPRAR